MIIKSLDPSTYLDHFTGEMSLDLLSSVRGMPAPEVFHTPLLA